MWRHLFNRARSLSIRTKTAAGVLFLLLCFGGVVIFGVRVRMAAVMLAEDQDQAILTARNIEGAISSGLLEQSPPEARVQLRRWTGTDQDIAYVFVTDGSGTVRASMLEDSCPPKVVSADTVSGSQKVHVVVLDTQNGPIQDIAVPITFGKAGTVRVGISEAHIRRAVNGMTRFLLLLTGGTMLFGVLGAYLLASLIVNPIVQLTTASEAIRSGNLQQRVPVRGGGEVARLAASFNVMADALARSQRDRRGEPATRTAQQRTHRIELGRASGQPVPGLGGGSQRRA